MCVLSPRLYYSYRVRIVGIQNTVEYVFKGKEVEYMKINILINLTLSC